MGTFFIADMHFDDQSIKNYENRPFSTVDEMNQTMIERWNKVVTDEDEVFVLGDVGNIEYVTQLKGKKYLVKGNHDIHENDFYRKHGFSEVYDFPIIYKGFWMLSHEPLYVNTNMPYANIFGHIHNNPNYKDSSSHGFCACVERINFTPIEIEKIKELM